MFIFFVSYNLMLSGNFYGSEIWHGIFWGVKFWSRDFLGFCFWSPRDFLGFDFCPHSNFSVTWNAKYPPGRMCKVVVLPTNPIVCLFVFHVLVAVASSKTLMLILKVAVHTWWYCCLSQGCEGEGLRQSMVASTRTCKNHSGQI